MRPGPAPRSSRFQAANSGHPGTPMALAPVAYCLWQQFLRFDPNDPIWPNRDRFVLSAGHASMLLYSLLHLTGVKAVNTKYETLGEPSVPLDDIKTLPPARQPLPRPPGVPLDQRRRDDHRPARPGRGHQRRHGHRRPAGWPRTSTGPASTMFDFNVYALVRRRLHDGGHLRRGRLAGRPPEALQPVLDLRQQPHHHRGQHRRWPSARTWPRASSAYGWNVTRVGDANDLEMLDARLPTSSRARSDRPTLIIVDSHIAYGVAQQAGHQRRPRRAARRGGDPG